MFIPAWLIVTLLTIEAVCKVVTIGYPRPPITRRYAAFTVALNAVIIVWVLAT